MAISSVLPQIARRSKTLLPPIAQRLRNKVALITGAANGFGATTAKLFANHGAKVILTNIQDDLSQSIIQEINFIGSGSFLHCNVADEQSVKALINATIAQHGKLDILISNAGTIIEPSTATPKSDPDSVKNYNYDMNVLGAFNCAKHAARVMVEAETEGSILFTAAVPRGMPHVYTSKNTVVGLTRGLGLGLGLELGRHQIRVNCISSHELRNSKEEVLLEDDVAKAALYLASDEAKCVSGINLVVNGGYRISN